MSSMCTLTASACRANLAEGETKIINRFKILLAEKEIRDGRNWSHRAIHEATGIATSTLSDYARNKVSRFHAVILEALCEFFECEVGDLLVRAGEQQK